MADIVVTPTAVTMTLTLEDQTLTLTQNSAAMTLSTQAVGTVNTSFLRGLFVENPATDDEDPIFFTHVAITLSELRTIINGGASPSVDWTIRFSADASDRTAGTEVIVGGSTSTSKTTGDSETSFDNGTIPANVFVWLLLTDVTTGADVPDSFDVTLMGSF
jgi:hypothetical protein